MKQFKTIQDAMAYLDYKYTLTNVESIMEGRSLRIKMRFPSNKKLSLKRDGFLTIIINGKLRETVIYLESIHHLNLNDAIDGYLNGLGKLVYQAMVYDFKTTGINIPIYFHTL